MASAEEMAETIGRLIDDAEGAFADPLWDERYEKGIGSEAQDPQADLGAAITCLHNSLRHLVTDIPADTRGSTP